MKTLGDVYKPEFVLLHFVVVGHLSWLDDINSTRLPPHDSTDPITIILFRQLNVYRILVASMKKMRSMKEMRPMESVVGPSDEARVILSAMNNSDFRWRTIRGIAKDAKLPPNEVTERVLDLQSKGIVIRASAPNKNGEPLFTTVEKYEESTPVATRIMSSFSGKIL